MRHQGLPANRNLATSTPAYTSNARTAHIGSLPYPAALLRLNHHLLQSEAHVRSRVFISCEAALDEEESEPETATILRKLDNRSTSAASVRCSK